METDGWEMGRLCVGGWLGGRVGTVTPRSEGLRGAGDSAVVVAFTREWRGSGVRRILEGDLESGVPGLWRGRECFVTALWRLCEATSHPFPPNLPASTPRRGIMLRSSSPLGVTLPTSTRLYGTFPSCN